MMARGAKLAACDTMGVESLCERIVAGESQTAIAKSIGVSIVTLVDWIAREPERSARVREARILAASSFADMAEQELRNADDPFELARARELASHYRWKASKANPREFGDKLAVGGAEDLPPMQSSIRLENLTDDQLRALASITVQA